MSTRASEALDARAMRLLLLIGDARDPVGARELGRRLGTADVTSESTLNRLLRQLDEQGLTRSRGGRGRVLSPAGRALADRVLAEQRWTEQLGRLDLRTLQDVRDLLAARRGLEREVVRAAALASTPADIAIFERCLEDYERSMNADDQRRVVATDFHKALATASPNRMLKAAAMVLFDDRFDVFEQVLDILTEGRGRTHVGPREHRAVLAAIKDGDPDRAERLMVQHLDRLAEDATGDVSDATQMAIELFLARGSGGAVG